MLKLVIYRLLYRSWKGSGQIEKDNFQIKQSLKVLLEKKDFFEKRNNSIYQETLDIYDSLREFQFSHLSVNTYASKCSHEPCKLKLIVCLLALLLL